MAVHRTLKQKKIAQSRREQVGYQLPDVPMAKPMTARTADLHTQDARSLIVRDLWKTVLITLYLLVLLLIIWWRLR